jgi:hypothetical protein
LSLRDSLNQRPVLAASLVGMALLALVALIWWQIRGATPAVPRTYYTIDDGVTYFSDDPTRVTPFEYRGKQAVRAHVFRGPDGKEFVGYLERSNPAAVAVMNRVRNRKPNDPPITPADIGVATAGREVKKPGDKDWVPSRGERAQKITTITAPDGSPAIEVE